MQAARYQAETERRRAEAIRKAGGGKTPALVAVTPGLPPLESLPAADAIPFVTPPARSRSKAAKAAKGRGKGRGRGRGRGRWSAAAAAAAAAADDAASAAAIAAYDQMMAQAGSETPGPAGEDGSEGGDEDDEATVDATSTKEEGDEADGPEGDEGETKPEASAAPSATAPSAGGGVQGPEESTAAGGTLAVDGSVHKAHKFTKVSLIAGTAGRPHVLVGSCELVMAGGGYGVH